MKIVIAAGIYPPDVGGPAQYAYHIAGELEAMGHETRVLAYGLEKKLPTGIRHLYYFLRMLFSLGGAHAILAFDSYSVGFPALCAAKLRGKKIIIRQGGDFLWESHVERTGNLVPLSRFYDEAAGGLNIKEKIIKRITGFTLRHAHAVAFNSSWFRDILAKQYSLKEGKTHIIHNYAAPKAPSFAPARKNFIFAARRIKLKNGAMLAEAFDEARKIDPDIVLETGLMPHAELMEKIAHACAVILPSISEVSPNLIFDAIRFDKPFIVTRESGIYEELKDVGIFVNPLDRNDIREKILFLADPLHYAEAVKKVKSYGKTRSWRQITEEFLSIYSRL